MKRWATFLLFLWLLKGGNFTTYLIKLEEFRMMPVACVLSQKVYVLYPYFSKVIIYNLSGKKLKEFGRKGEGPGEFYGPYDMQCINGRIYISDTKNRISVFDPDGNFERSIKIKSFLAGPAIIIGSSVFYLKGVIEKNVQKTILVKADRHKEVSLEEFEEGVPLREMVFPMVFPAIVYLNDSLVYVDKIKGQVKIFNEKGEMVKEFQIGLSPKKVTKEWIKNFKKSHSFFFKKDKRINYKVRFRKTLPVVDRVFSDGKEKIILEEYFTSPSVFHIFNSSGKRIKVLKIEKPLLTVSGDYWIFLRIKEDSRFLELVNYRLLN